MAYCIQCGATMEHGVPPGDDRARLWCRGCGYVHYVNPTLLVSVILYCDDALLWIRRATAPAAHLWAFPAGFVESGETLQQAAARELAEETCIAKAPQELLLIGIGSLLAINQIYVVFRCPVPERLNAQITAESEAWQWFREHEVPWDQMAFPEMEMQIRELYRWIREGDFGISIGEVNAAGDRYTRLPLK